MDNTILISINLNEPVPMNFGDIIAPKFFQLLVEKPFVQVNFSASINSYLTVGSHLRVVTPYHTIIGSGFISEDDDLGKGDWTKYTNKVYNLPKEILSVRGPKTRNKLLKMNVKCPKNYGDPLLLFPLIYNPMLPIKYKIGIIPHYIDKNNMNYLNLVKYFSSNHCTIKIIDIETGPNFTKLIDDIKQCEFIISSTLHGVILSIAYFKKTIWTRFSQNVIGGDFKFQDFFQSLNVNYSDPKSNDTKILQKTIKVKKGDLFNLGIDILNVCPFIEQKRLYELNKLWLEYIYNNEFI